MKDQNKCQHQAGQLGRLLTASKKQLVVAGYYSCSLDDTDWCVLDAGIPGVPYA